MNASVFRRFVRIATNFTFVTLGATTLSCAAPSDMPSSLLAPPAAPVTAVRVFHNPYSGIDWATTYRLKSQHHDHVGDAEPDLRAYDAAGYDVMSLMQYSGVASISYSWHEEHWPVSTSLTPTFVASLKNIKFFIPNSETVGYWHLTTPFLTQYIAKWEPDYYPKRMFWHYGDDVAGWVASSQQAITLTDSLGGTPILAHPYAAWSNYETLHGYKGTEIYSGYLTFKHLEGLDTTFATDLNPQLQSNWDQMLMRDQSIIGIAVNDHYGPNYLNSAYTPRLRDSGKILVLTTEATYAAYVPAFKRGAILAVKDYGLTKGGYPNLTSIGVDSAAITINTSLASDSVLWIANGTQISTARRLPFSLLPLNTRYVRAIVSNSDSSQVFTQAFGIRMVGDVNGDGVRDANDTAICVAVRAGSDTDADHIAACKAIP